MLLSFVFVLVLFVLGLTLLLFSLLLMNGRVFRFGGTRLHNAGLLYNRGGSCSGHFVRRLQA